MKKKYLSIILVLILLAISTIFVILNLKQESINSIVPSKKLNAGDGIKYNIFTGSEFEPTGIESEHHIPLYGGYPFFCVGAGVDTKMGDISYYEAEKYVGTYYGDHAHASVPFDWSLNGKLTNPLYKKSGDGTLSDKDAYIISHDGSGWSEVKQHAIWGGAGAHDHDGMGDAGKALIAEAEKYAAYAAQAKDGLNPSGSGDAIAKVNSSSKQIILGPYSINYDNGNYGDITFGGISEILVVADNGTEIPISGLIIGDELVSNIHYFTPDGNKVDRAEQTYPEPGEEFQVVFTVPEDSEIKSVSIKVKFKYMLASGVYADFVGHQYVVSISEYDDYNNDEYSCCSSGSLHRCRVDFDLEQVGSPQPVRCMDAVRTIYEEEIEFGPTEIIMELGGNVWEDVRAGKENELNGMQDEGEPPVVGIPVTLYKEDGTVVAQTTTDASGAYKFTDLYVLDKYYVQFEYNGQQYQNTIYNNNLAGGYSNATESMKDRDEFNKKFEEIDGDEGYTLEDLNWESEQRYMPNELFGISAYTGSDGLNGLQTYPKYDTFVIGEEDVEFNGVTYHAIYKEGDSQKEIDFGITRRIEFDMALKKDLYIATVKINGKTQVYGYDQRNIGNNDGETGDTWNINIVGGYERGLDPSDYNYTGQNYNKEEVSNQLLEVYVTYKIAVRNQSQSMLGHVTKLYDYYDNTFTFEEGLSWQSNTNYKTDEETLNKLQDAMAQGKLLDENLEKINVLSNKDNKLEIDVGKKQASGETVYLYLTFKLNSNNEGKIELGEKENAVEIGAFKTYYKAGTILPHYGENNYEITSNDVIAGRVDKDSIPSNYNKEQGPQEDDEDKAPALNVNLLQESRKINGNVWEDERTKTEDLDGAIIGNGLREEDEKGVGGITVELLIKTAKGNYIKWQEAQATKDNGNYEFSGYIPGDYIVRFTYGNNAGDIYNGQDFKSTTYQAGIEQKEHTDIDGNYNGYTDIENQNESKSYGYDIAASEGKNVSDAKDIWKRRETVINYSNSEVTNNKAEILASPYTGNKDLQQELAKNTYMVAETGVIVVEVEKNTQTTVGSGNPAYSLDGIDLGLEERPKAQLEIDKKVTHIKVTLANGTILFDVEDKANNVLWRKHEQYNLDEKAEKSLLGYKKLEETKKYEDYYGEENKNRYSYREEVDNIVNNNDHGLIQLTMDEELMHGATIETTYAIKVKNVGEKDYNNKNFYYIGTKGTDIVTTSADQVIDYISNNFKFDKNNSDNTDWDNIDKTSLLGNLVNTNLTESVNKFNYIITTNKLGKALTPGEETDSQKLTLSEVITRDNSEDELTYKNIVEIVKTSNTVGRRMAFSIVGNQDPTKEPAEVDSSRAERIIILTPFGDNTIIYIISAIIVLIVLIAGIIIIKTKVLKTKK